MKQRKKSIQSPVLPALLAILVFGSVPSLRATESPRFRSDDPLSEDPDNLPSPIPESQEIPQMYDFLTNTFLTRTDENEPILRAENVNTVGEVPDSSWFTNRMGKKVMSIEELITGPNVSGGPDTTRPWTVISAKAQGITPGFTIRDANGVVFFVKFDPPKNPQMGTSTEAVATRFFHAFGYNVPENYLSFVRKKDLVISEDARLTDIEGKERAFTKTDLDKIFARIYRGSDGRTPVIASRLLEGKPLGPYAYFGTRPDDLNDIIAHENRRELRGLRVFSAWLNHDDSRSINSLDMYVGEPGQGHVKHYLIDFGSCLGSGSVKVQTRRAGNEYILEWGPIIKSAVTLGIWDRPWRHVEYPDYPAVGRFEGDFFEPGEWRPEYPNPAFDRMLPEDAFWATKIVMRFTDGMIGALVRTGEYFDKRAEDYLVRTLIKRRDKIVLHYLPQVAAYDEFEVVARQDRLVFKDLLLEAGLATSTPILYDWSRFDNWTQQTTPISSQESTRELTIPIPSDMSEYLMVRIENVLSSKVVRVYLRKKEGTFELVGLDREAGSTER